MGVMKMKIGYEELNTLIAEYANDKTNHVYAFSDDVVIFKFDGDTPDTCVISVTVSEEEA